MKTAMLAAGGTGGHVYPACELARELTGRGWRAVLATDDRGMRYAGGFPGEKRALSSAPLKGGLGGLGSMMRLWRGYREALRYVEETRATAAVGFGGYPSAAPLLAAMRKGVCCVVHEQNARAGKANRWLSGRAWGVAESYEGTTGLRGDRRRLTGTPLRVEVKEAAALLGEYEAPKGGGEIRVLGLGGSQGSSGLARCAASALGMLGEGVRGRLRVDLQRREEDAEVDAALRGAGIEVNGATFFEDVAERISRAHLVLCRCGASTLAEAAALGRPAMTFPLLGGGGEQEFNARALEEAGAAVRGDEADAKATSRALGELLEEGGRLERMAKASRGFGEKRGDAALLLADFVEEASASGKSGNRGKRRGDEAAV